MLSIGEAAALAARCCQAGDLPRAEQLYRHLLAELHNQLGIVSAQQGKLGEAVANFREAARCRPDVAVFSNLGNALRMQGRLDEAEDAGRQALALQPDHAEACNNLGLTLMKQGRLAEAQALYRQALALRPDYAVAHSNLLLCLTYDPAADAATVLAEHRRWADLHGRAPAGRPFANTRDPDRRLRVGYVSPDLCGHVVAYFLAPILRHHDTRQVEVFCYAEVAHPDATTASLRGLAQAWRSTCGLADAQVAELVRGDGIDLLVDLAGHTAGHRLGVFAHRPAPVQVTYLGYPNATGLPAIGYRLTDAVADPPGSDAAHAEELVRLPGCFCCYAPPADAPDVGPPPARHAGHVTFGALHDLAKVNDAVLDLWCDVLRAVPTARLLLFRHTLRGRVRDDFARRFATRGVAADRIDLRHETDGGPGFLGVYGGVDVLLDAFPWSGHVTTCEALWMGVPVVTLASRPPAGRLAATVLRAVGLDDLVADTPAGYVAAASALAADAGRLIALGAGLRERVRRSPLCDGAAFTRNLEAAYRAMWRRWATGGEG